MLFCTVAALFCERTLQHIEWNRITLCSFLILCHFYLNEKLMKLSCSFAFIAGLLSIPCSLTMCQNYESCFFSAGTVGCKCPDQRKCDRSQNDPICATDGKTYINQCLMEAKSCKSGNHIVPVSRGPCGRLNRKRQTCCWQNSLFL